MVDEEAHLLQADRHIADAERRIADQERLLVALTAAGHDDTQARRLLANFQDILRQFQAHRRLILAELGRHR